MALFSKHSLLALAVSAGAFCIFTISGIKLSSAVGAKPEVSVTDVQNRDVAKYFNAGYGGFFSSAQWVGSIFYYAEVVFEKKPAKPLHRMIQQAWDLDTNWSYPGLMAAWVLVDYEEVDKTNVFQFLAEGASRFPKEWRFRVTWAEYLRNYSKMDPSAALDSASVVLMPLTRLGAEIPDYARTLAFTTLAKNGKPGQALSNLLQLYEQMPDPLLRLQFQRKIGDILFRSDVKLGSDSSAFIDGIGLLLNSDASQISAAKSILIRMVQPETKDAAVLEARQLALQFREYQSAQLGSTR